MNQGTRHTARVKQILTFSLGALAGAGLLFAILNGGACRPEPTPTDEGTPVQVVPKEDKPIAAPVAPASVSEVKPEPIATLPVPDIERPNAPVEAPSKAIEVEVKSL